MADHEDGLKREISVRPMYVQEDDWVACEHPERPYDQQHTMFCAHPCRGCLVVAEMQLNLIDPTEDYDACLAFGELIEILSGEAVAVPAPNPLADLVEGIDELLNQLLRGLE